MKSLKLVVAWLVVGLPLSWGIYHSVKKSLPLFRGVVTPGATVPSPR